MQDVRGRIAAIPQEPILFSGSIRSNVDPYSAHSDAEIWLALERVNLKVPTDSYPLPIAKCPLNLPTDSCRLIHPPASNTTPKSKAAWLAAICHRVHAGPGPQAGARTLQWVLPLTEAEHGCCRTVFQAQMVTP